MVNWVLIVEGGAKGQLAVEARRAFSTLLKNAGLRGKLPRVVAGGGRGEAFDRYQSALRTGERLALLVDSEDAVTTEDPWAHVRQRDNWARPSGATAEQLHLMVRSMEAWLLRDPSALAKYFGKGFAPNRLPSGPPENVDRHATVDALERAATDTTKRGYKKGRDGFRLMELMDPALLNGEAWAKRFLDFAKRQ